MDNQSTVEAPEATEASQESANDPLTACQAELEEAKTKLMYLTAEFDNYKKRTAKEQASWAEYAQDKALLDLLNLSDDIERALSELEGQELPQEAVSHFEGFALIVKNFGKLFQKYNVEQIKTDKVFDPALCEAVMQQESADHQSGEIISVIQKGYQRNSRVIRPAKVIVAK